MKPVIRALLVVVASVAGGIIGALALGASVASAGGPLMPIVVTWPTSGPVHVGEALTIESNCPVLTVVNGAPVFDSIVTLKLGAKVLWHQPHHIAQNTQPCVSVAGAGTCAWPGTGVCTGSVPYQVPAVFEVVVPSGAVSGEITAIDGYGSVIAKGAVTVAGTKPSQPTTVTVPTGTTPTTHATTPKTSTPQPHQPSKPLTPHGASAKHLPWWRAIWDRILRLF